MQTATTIVIVFTVVIIIAAFVFALYYKKQEQAREEGKRPKSSSASLESKNKASSLKDTREYIKEIEDIRDGILITEGATRFIAALTCRGVGDFYDQSASEQMGVMKGYLGFINTLKSPITYRMFTKELDMDYTIKKYSDKKEEFEKKYKFLEASLSGIPKERQDEQERLLREMKNLEFRIAHLDSQINAINYYSSSAVAMEQVQSYVIEWKYRSADFDVDMTPAERFVRAKEELDVLASAKIAALSAGGVKARVCTQGEMIDMCRRVSQPISVERFRMKELEKSSFFDDINTSDSLKGLEYLVGQEFSSSLRKGFMETLFSDDEASSNEEEQEEDDDEFLKDEENEDNGKEVFTFGEEE